MACYGLSFFLPFMAQVRSMQAMKTRKDKMRIYNLPYGSSKRGFFFPDIFYLTSIYLHSVILNISNKRNYNQLSQREKPKFC